MPPRLRLPATLLLLALALVGLFRLAPLQTDMADFLPRGSSAGSAVLMRELRSGAATSIILAGIEQAPEAELARLSTRLAAALRDSGRFALMANGPASFPEAEQALLFRHRYLLSPAVSPAMFEPQRLRQDLVALLDGLRSSAAPLLQRFGLADPVGAFLALLRGWFGEAAPETRSGVWFAPGGGRALLLARINAAGLDAEAQAAALQIFRSAFAAAEPGPARLLLSGPGVFTAEAATAIRADVERLSLLSTLLIAGFLLWRYRSLLLLAAVAVPLAGAVLAGALAVLALHGQLHGAALGFGMTMLGVAVDYPILLLTQQREDEGLAETARRLWPTLRLAAGAAALGLAAMLGSGFTGLVQLGVFAAAGLLASAAITRWLLPLLLPTGRLRARPLPAPLVRLLLLALPRWRLGTLALVTLAAGWLLLQGGPAWNPDVESLSPVPADRRALDAELRRQIGAPDVRHLVALQGTSEQDVLRRAERLGAALQPLVAAGALRAADLPSRYLPSAATQAARQALLPEDTVLRQRLQEAAAGLPFRATAFDTFLADIAASRTLPPLQLDDLRQAPGLQARLSPLLQQGAEGWRGLAILSGLSDQAAVQAAIAALADPGLLLVDIRGETQAMFDRYTGAALAWVGIGGLGVLGLLALGLRSPRRALVVAMPLVAATIITLAVLSALGQALTLFHAMALLLMAGVGLDYALFLGRAAGEPIAEATWSLTSVTYCTVTTMLTFGLLAFCETPVLRSIGQTVVLGVASALLLSCALLPRRAD